MSLPLGHKQNLTPEQVLWLSQRTGVELTVKDGKLHAAGSRTSVQALSEHLRQHKLELLRLLTTPTPNAVAIDWRSLRDVYYSHHANCPVCIAAGNGYGIRCGAGVSLWAAYSATNGQSTAFRHSADNK